MSLSTLLLGVWLVLVGLVLPGWIHISPTLLGVWALTTGITVLLEGFHPLVIYKRR